jgi:hypothetical protein
MTKHQQNKTRLRRLIAAVLLTRAERKRHGNR